MKLPTPERLRILIRRESARRWKGSAPPACWTCEHFVEKSRECRVLIALQQDCIVRVQARKNARRGIQATP